MNPQNQAGGQPQNAPAQVNQPLPPSPPARPAPGMPVAPPRPTAPVPERQTYAPASYTPQPLNQSYGSQPIVQPPQAAATATPPSPAQPAVPTQPKIAPMPALPVVEVEAPISAPLTPTPTQTPPLAPAMEPAPIPTPPAPPPPPQPPSPPAQPQYVVPPQSPVIPPAPEPPKPAQQPPVAASLSTTGLQQTPPVAAASPANYTPPIKHIPEEIAEEISEVPQQNSTQIKEAAEHSRRHRIKNILSFLGFVGGIFLAAFLINQFIFQSYFVDGTSMVPTLQHDDRLIIDKVERTLSQVQGKPYIPERGQIVVLDSSIMGTNGRNEQLIKRVIGLPGDTVVIRDGVVTIKNKDNPAGFNVDEQLGLHLPATYTDTPIEITVPSEEVFVLGDNRAQNGSYDSRAFGSVEVTKLEGRLWARILPIDKAQIF